MEEIAKALQQIVGAENVSNAKPILEAYVTRAIMDMSSKALAIVVRPKNLEEIQAVLKLANEKRIPVVPHSGGLSGGVKSGYPEWALEVSAERVKEAEQLGVEAILSACPFCERNLADAINKLGSNLKVLDVVELVNKAL
jgi:FAD/FMN-containing dehydrogenase